MSQARNLEEQADQAAAAGHVAAARALLEQAVEAGAATSGQWTKLSAMRRASGDLSGAMTALDQSLALSPLDFSALLGRAFVLETMGDPAAGQAFGNALAQAPVVGQLSDELKPAVARARARWSAHQDRLEQQLGAAMPAALSSFETGQIRRLITNRSRRTRHYHQEPTDFHYPGMPEIEFHDRALFPALDALEAQWEAIRAEFEAVVAANAAEIVPYTQYPDRVPLRQWRELNNSPKWSAIHLLQNGRRIDANTRHCPVTMAAIAKLPQPHIAGGSPNAMFSLLAPHTRIPAHTGVANTRLVCHLPLIVPPHCGFRVGDSRREWQPGKAFVFDDTIEHEAWNDSAQLRVVLIVDLWPPTLSDVERRALADVIAAVGLSFSGI
ncbi:MAG: aspartyl/asparaginyl beta-hydroxylase domain-containing protein [Sphingomicrobium sp.]